MTDRKRNRRFRPLVAAAVAALGLGALAMPTSSANAQIFFGCGIGGCSVGLAAPAPYYYAPRHYVRPYYEPYVVTPAPLFYPW